LLKKFLITYYLRIERVLYPNSSKAFAFFKGSKARPSTLQSRHESTGQIISATLQASKI